MSTPRLHDVETPFLASQALSEGLVTRRTLRGPAVRRLFRGVYLPAGIPVDHRLRVQGAGLLLPPGAAVSGRSAAVALGCELARETDPVEVSVPEAARFGPVRGLLVTRTELRGGDVQRWHDVEITTPARTLFDLARSRTLPDAVADVDAFLRHTDAPVEVLDRVLRSRRVHGVVQAREVVRLADPRAQSRPESIVRCHLNLAGLWPVPQLGVDLLDGSRVRVDLGFERERVAVEHDGAWHALREQLRRDRDRMSALRRAGWTTVHVTDQLLARGPRALVREVTGALAESRWAA